MQLANCLVALGGDKGNTVPKYGVTPAEILVLQAIHGNDAVLDVEPAGEAYRPAQAELTRLREVYGRANDEDNKPIIDGVFPGRSSPLPLTLAAIELPPDAYKALTRAAPTAAPTPQAEALVATAPEAPALADGELPEIEADPPEADAADFK